MKKLIIKKDWNTPSSRRALQGLCAPDVYFCDKLYYSNIKYDWKWLNKTIIQYTIQYSDEKEIHQILHLADEAEYLSKVEETFDNCGFNDRSLWSHGRIVETAAKFFVGCSNVLDIGSGIGKFVIMASQFNKDTIFTGVEIDNKYYKISKSIKEHFKADKVKLIKDNFCNLDLSIYDGIYIFNPFHMSTNNHNSNESIKFFENILCTLNIGTKLAMNNRQYIVPKSWRNINNVRGVDYYIKES